ncbi:hypothetical protein [Acidihalobacter yilgarnensis]|nr:hypothetical protein [Acidihalobacter yilgarnensis]
MQRFIRATAVLLLGTCLPTPVIAEVMTIPVKALPVYLHAHANVVAQFTSPDPDCTYCVHANPPFDAVSTHPFRQ